MSPRACPHCVPRSAHSASARCCSRSAWRPCSSRPSASSTVCDSPGPAGQSFGEARLKATLSAHRGASAAELADRLLAEVGAGIGGAPKEAAEREDDVTLVVLDRLAAPPA